MTEYCEQVQRTSWAVWFLIAALTLCGCQPAATSPSASAPRTSRPPIKRPIVEPVSELVKRDDSDADTADSESNRDLSPAVDPDPAQTETSHPTAQNTKSVKPHTFRVLTDPRPLYKPQVVLSGAHRESCLVAVGDLFPLLELSDVSGSQRIWNELLGPNLTIVVFWSSQSAFAIEQVARLELETSQLCQGTGVHVVAVNVGDAADQVSEWTHGAGESVVHLVDSDQSAFAKIATRQFPRTYLLNSTGRILWLDLEYSQTTRRDLENAVRYFLKHPPRQASS